jgi:hypothetical protein
LLNWRLIGINGYGTSPRLEVVIKLKSKLPINLKNGSRIGLIFVSQHQKKNLNPFQSLENIKNHPTEGSSYNLRTAQHGFFPMLNNS